MMGLFAEPDRLIGPRFAAVAALLQQARQAVRRAPGTLGLRDRRDRSGHEAGPAAAVAQPTRRRAGRPAGTSLGHFRPCPTRISCLAAALTSVRLARPRAPARHSRFTAANGALDPEIWEAPAIRRDGDDPDRRGASTRRRKPEPSLRSSRAHDAEASTIGGAAGGWGVRQTTIRRRSCQFRRVRKPWRSE